MNPEIAQDHADINRPNTKIYSTMHQEYIYQGPDRSYHRQEYPCHPYYSPYPVPPSYPNPGSNVYSSYPPNYPVMQPPPYNDGSMFLAEAVSYPGPSASAQPGYQNVNDESANYPYVVSPFASTHGDFQSPSSSVVDTPVPPDPKQLEQAKKKQEREAKRKERNRIAQQKSRKRKDELLKEQDRRIFELTRALEAEKVKNHRLEEATNEMLNELESLRKLHRLQNLHES